MTPQTTLTLSHKFIAALEERRDVVYAAAREHAGDEDPAGASAKAESLLHAAVRESFSALEKNPALEPAEVLDLTLAPMTTAPVSAPEPMPADIWARLVAAVQVEAARSAHSRAINRDSVLLSPDPLLAPKKMAAPDDVEGFNLSPSSRFLIAAVVAVLIGIGLTLFLLTRPTPPAATLPTGHTRAPAASAP